MQSHGMMWESSTGEGPYPGFRTGTVAMDVWDNVFPGFFPGFVNNGDYIQDLLLFRLAVSNKANNAGLYHYVVLPSFIDYYVSDMPDTFMYLGFCHSMQNDAMWKAFERKGAKVFFGWDEEMYRDDNTYFFDELMQRMLPDDASIIPQTAVSAFNDIDDYYKEGTTLDGNPSFAVMKTSSPEWGNFIYLYDKEYLVISGREYAVVWDIQTNSLAQIPLDSGGFAAQPVLKSSISNWVSSRQILSSHDLYISRRDGLSANNLGGPECFDQAPAPSACSWPYSIGDSETLSDSCSIQYLEHIGTMSITKHQEVTANVPEAADPYVCNFSTRFNRNFMYWGAIEGLANWSSHLAARGIPNLEWGVNFANPINELGSYGSEKIISQTTGDERYLHMSWNQAFEGSSTSYEYIDYGAPIFIYQDFVDTISIKDPWGFTWSESFSSYEHNYVDPYPISFGYNEILKHNVDFKYLLLGIYTEEIIAQLRIAQIDTYKYYCHHDDDWGTLFGGCTTFCYKCKLNLISSDSTPVNVVASINKSQDPLSVNPFAAPRNPALEIIIKELVKLEWPYELKVLY
jgi:hypothetical protein